MIWEIFAFPLDLGRQKWMPAFAKRIKLGARDTHSEVVLGLETLASWAILHTLNFWG